MINLTNHKLFELKAGNRVAIVFHHQDTGPPRHTIDGHKESFNAFLTLTEVTLTVHHYETSKSWVTCTPQAFAPRG
jgi:hypothetical protein